MKAPRDNRPKIHFLFTDDSRGKEFIILGTDEEDAKYNAWLRFSKYTLVRKLSEEEIKGSELALLPIYS